jgi:hypothetical protein
LNISWGTVSTTANSLAGSCSATVTNGKLYITVTNFAPGDTCTVTGSIGNSGSLPGSLSEAISGSTGPFSYSDNIHGTISAHGTYAYNATISLPGGTGNGAQGASATFDITITATAGT